MDPFDNCDGWSDKPLHLRTPVSFLRVHLLLRSHSGLREYVRETKKLSKQQEKGPINKFQEEKASLAIEWKIYIPKLDCVLSKVFGTCPVFVNTNYFGARCRGWATVRIPPGLHTWEISKVETSRELIMTIYVFLMCLFEMVVQMR